MAIDYLSAGWLVWVVVIAESQKVNLLVSQRPVERGLKAAPPEIDAAAPGRQMQVDQRRHFRISDRVVAAVAQRIIG